MSYMYGPILVSTVACDMPLYFGIQLNVIQIELCGKNFSWPVVVINLCFF